MKTKTKTLEINDLPDQNEASHHRVLCCSEWRSEVICMCIPAYHRNRRLWTLAYILHTHTHTLFGFTKQFPKQISWESVLKEQVCAWYFRYRSIFLSCQPITTDLSIFYVQTYRRLLTMLSSLCWIVLKKKKPSRLFHSLNIPQISFFAGYRIHLSKLFSSPYPWHQPDCKSIANVFWEKTVASGISLFSTWQP